MTRIAVMADVHGNLHALEAALNDLKQAAPDLVIFDGDMVNRGPQSKECLTVIRQTGWPVVFGNHEEYVLKAVSGDVPEDWESDWWLPSRRSFERLSAEEVSYIAALPRFFTVDLPGLPAIRVLHGSPRYLNEGLGHWMSNEDLLEAVQSVPEPIVIGAHTHRPLDRRVNGRWILNCGSVGVPYNGNPAAQYLMLTAQGSEWQAEFRAVSYDRTPLYDVWEQTGYLQASMIAQLFKYEIETATFHLMPYVSFCEANGLETNSLSSFRRYREASMDVKPGRSLMVS